jgi:PhnB protein
MMKTKPIPARYQFAVIPHIFIKGASEAIAFYEKGFGAKELFRVSKPDGQIIHAELSVGNCVFMVGEAEAHFHDPKSLKGTCVGLHLYTDNVDSLVSRSVSAGAVEIGSIQDMFYGDRMGTLQDPFGHIWVLLTHQEDVQPQEIKNRGEALFRQ